MPSIVAELGAIVEQHLKMIGLLHDPELDPEQRRLIAEKRAAYEARATGKDAKKKSDVGTPAKAEAKSAPQDLSTDLAGVGGESARKQGEVEFAETAKSEFPPGATMCNKCNTQAVILMDGCQTCLKCGYSKCG